MAEPEADVYEQEMQALRGLYDRWVEPPKETIGKLPKAGVKLDYVGHANVTRALLECDPGWTWEPVALNDDGLPAYDKSGGLWIRLTVCGVTRLGYGDGPDPKQRISDALRNAAMRFGVALSLWSKEEFTHDEDSAPPVRAVLGSKKTAVQAVEPTEPGDPADLELAGMRGRLRARIDLLPTARRALLRSFCADRDIPPRTGEMRLEDCQQVAGFLDGLDKQEGDVA